MTLGLEGAWSGKRGYWIAAGALAAFATLCTPSIAVVGGITGLALLMPPWRRFFPPFALAAIATAALAVLVMTGGGYFRAFVAQMQWLSKNYSDVNVTGYGEVNGGYPALLQSLAEVWLPFRVVLLLSITLAAVLPVVAILGWGTAWVVRKGKAFPEAGRLAIPYLLACLAGYVASTYPRPNLGHLMVIAPLGYVLVTILISRYFAAARLTIFVLMIPCALLPAVHAVGAIAAEVPVRTPVGEVRVAVEDRASLQSLLDAGPAASDTVCASVFAAVLFPDPKREPHTIFLPGARHDDRAGRSGDAARVGKIASRLGTVFAAPA